MLVRKPKIQDNSKAQAAQLAELKKANKAEADAVAARDAETRALEDAQAKLRAKRRSGLLAYTEDAGGAGLQTKLGG